MRYNALQADATLKQHQLWFLKRAESEADQAASRPMPTRPSTTSKAAWPTCATSRPSWKPFARRTTPPATR
jgi:hypothetical protein